MSRFIDLLLRHLTSLMILLVGITLTTIWSVIEINDERQQREHAAENIVKKYAANLQSSLDQRLFTLDALNAFVHSYAELDLEDEVQEKQFSQHFRQFADELHISVDGILSLQLAPQGVISYMTGNQQNSKALGYDLFEMDNRREQIIRAIYEHSQVITGPIHLIQGGEGIIARKAIFAAHSPNASPERLKEKLLLAEGSLVPRDFWGLASVLFTTEALLQKAGLYQTKQENFEFAIKGRHGMGFDGEVFWGAPDIFTDPASLHIIEFDAGSWVLAVRHATHFPVIRIIMIVVLGLVLTGLAIYGEILFSKNRSARESERAKDIFLASMSHEIRSPLNGIVGMTSLLRRTALNDEQQRLINGIESSTSHLSAVIGDILDFSKIAAGKIELEYHAVELDELIEQCLDMVRPQAEAKSHSLKIQIDDALSGRYIKTDKTRFKQILVNLLSNAIKFTPNGGEITVHVYTQEHDDEARLLIDVIDNGIGMTEAEMTRLFQRFSQGDPSTTRKYGGTGLGLAISRNLSRLMNGDLTVNSRKNQGSTFTLTLPLTLTSAPPRLDIQPSLEDQQLPSQLKILVVDDLPMNRQMMLMMLKKIGFRADEAANGLEAITLQQENAYDVIFMDWEMPEVDGVEATRRIRKLPGNGNKPWIIALTANANSTHKEQCLAAGMNDYVSKPVSIEDIVNKLKQIKGNPV